LKRYFAGVRSLAIVSNIPLSFVPRAFTETRMATGGDQRILDGRGAGLVLDEARD
jgi:hypothetical protein